MKTKIVYTTFFSIVLFLIFSGYKEGPAVNSGWDCTGAETDFQNPTGCTTGGGCHASNATAGITVALELDSAGTPVTGYKGGLNYTVKLTGTNTTNSNLPAFGFQIASIAGTVAQVTPTNAGTWNTPPANTHIATPVSQEYSLNVVEHGQSLSPTTGTGGTNTTYVESFSWTAPMAGTGTVSIWAALNAVNNNGKADQGDLWNTNQMILTEDTATVSISTGLSSVSQPDGVRIFPNPVTDRLNLQLAVGNYRISIYNLSGQLIATIQSSTNAEMINTSSWMPGVYVVSIENGVERRAFRVLKE